MEPSSNEREFMKMLQESGLGPGALRALFEEPARGPLAESFREVVALYNLYKSASVEHAQIRGWRLVRRKLQWFKVQGNYNRYVEGFNAWVRLHGDKLDGTYGDLGLIPPGMMADLAPVLSRARDKRARAVRQRQSNEGLREHQARLEELAKPGPEEAAALEAARRFTWEK
ncbi:hypothetical protein [Kribbella sp. NPDC023855]|uniref:hypothetical protein n=1 Tax=Kribbella sp. NPDC023855 TaxID=3154698 RepID=UPI0033F28F6B